jgi:hypothetical protein
VVRGSQQYLGRDGDVSLLSGYCSLWCLRLQGIPGPRPNKDGYLPNLQDLLASEAAQERQEDSHDAGKDAKVRRRHRGHAHY